MRATTLVVFLAALLCACAGPAEPQAASTSSDQTSGPKKTLIVLMNDEPKKLGAVGAGGGSLQASATTPFIYDSFLAVLNDAGRPVPRLALEVPTVENGGWRLSADGSMETTWKLRTNAFWHDGTPFTARDLAFTWEVWQDPLVEVSRTVLKPNIDRVDTPDDFTVVYHWREPFAFIEQAGRLSILPDHLLADAFRTDKDQFNNHRYNTTDFIGLGPYRLKSWTPGSQLEFEAFERYFLGRPKIDSILARFIFDPNALTTTLLAGQADMNIPYGATSDVVFPVQEQWTRTNEGQVFIYPGPSLRFLANQERDVYLKTPALKQAPVREALMDALDKEALVTLLYRDPNLLADSWYALTDPRHQVFTDAIKTFGYDPGVARQLLDRQGWKPGPDGVLVNANGERFETSLTATAESGEAVAAIASYWRQIGVAVKEEVLSPAQTTDRENRAAFAGMEYTAHVPVRSFLAGRLPIAQIPSAENRWTGTNRNGLVDPQIDRLMASFDATVDARQREQVEREMLRYVTSNVLFGFLFFYPHQWMVRNTVTGVVPSKVAASMDDWPRVTWNVHDWELRVKSEE